MIEIGRNSIVVRNVDFESKEFKRANAIYSLYDKVQHKYSFSAFTIIDNDVYFPASIGINEIIKCFPKEDTVTNYMTTAKSSIIKYSMIHQPRDDLQKKAIKFLMNIKNDNIQRSRFLSLATGSGKTFVSIACISQLKKRSMIIVDSLALADQWKREFLNHTDMKESDISILSGQESVDTESKNPSAKVYIAIHRTLSNMLSTDFNSVNILMNRLKIGIRIFDESHVEFGNICKINSLSNVEYTFYLTATPNRSNFNDDSLYSKIFKQIPYFNGKDIVNNRYHTVVVFPFNSHPSLDVRASCRTKYGFSIQKWANYISTTGYDLFLEAVVDLFTKFKLLSRNKKTAIVLPTIELIKKLSKDLKELYPDIDLGLFIGEIKKEKRVDELNKAFILTDDKMFDKAIDVPGLEILINFVDFGSLVKIEQLIGRLRYNKDKSSIFFDMVDFGFDECRNHYKIRKRFYKKHTKSIIENSN